MKIFLKKAVSKRRILIFIIDLIMLMLSAVIATDLWLGEIRYFNDHLFQIIFIATIYILAFLGNNLYDIHRDYRKPVVLMDIVTSVFVGSLFLLAVFFFLPIIKSPSRPIFFLNALLVILTIYIGRRIYDSLFHLGFYQNVLIIGANETTGKFIKEIKKHPFGGYKIAGILYVLDKNKATEIEGTKVLGDYREVLNCVKNKSIDIVSISAETTHRNKELIKDLITCMHSGVDVEETWELYERITGRIPYEHVEESWFLYSKVGQDTFYKRIAKEILGRIGAFGILVITSPVILLTMILQKLLSKGPVFYIQERVGKFEEKFKIIKFRTMVENAEEQTGPVWAEKDDARVTWFGRFLRVTRIDELPQLVNVLRGEMSFVGPRPEREHFTAQFQQKIPYYSYRLSVMPGITGWAQIKHGYDTSIDNVREKLEYDFYYIKNMNLWLDFSIILNTIRVVLSGKGH